MKAFFKVIHLILSITFGILFVAASVVGSALLVYNLFPSLFNDGRFTGLTQWIGTIRDWVITHIYADLNIVAYISLGIMGFIFLMFVLLTWRRSSKFTNTFIMLTTILVSLILLFGPVFVFVNKLLAGGFSPDEIATGGIKTPSAIAMGSILLVYFFVKLFGGKLQTWIGSKVQAYDTAVEMRSKTRSSVVGINILKFFQMVFPEILICAFISIMLKLSEVGMIVNFFLGTAAFILLMNIWRGINISREVKRIILRDKTNQILAIQQTLQQK